MLQYYSTVYEHTLKRINSHAYTTKTYHEGNPLPLGTFLLKRNYSHVHFSDKLKPRIGPYKILDRVSDVTDELLSQGGSTLHVHRNHLIPYYPKEPLLYPNLRNFMRFSDSTHYDIPKQLIMQIVIHPFSILVKPYLTTIHHKMILLHLHRQNPEYNLRHQITILTFPHKLIHSPK